MNDIANKLAEALRDVTALVALNATNSSSYSEALKRADEAVAEYDATPAPTGRVVTQRPSWHEIEQAIRAIVGDANKAAASAYAVERLIERVVLAQQADPGNAQRDPGFPTVWKTINDELKAEIAALRRQCNETGDELNAAKCAAAPIAMELNQMTAERDDLRRQLAAKSDELHAVEIMRDAHESEARSFHAELTECRKQLDATEAGR